MFVDGKITMGQILTKVQAIQAQLLGKVTVFVDTFFLTDDDGTTIISVSILNKYHPRFEFRDWYSSEKNKAELKRLEEFVKTL